MRPLIVGIGGSASAGSATEQALGLALASAEQAGARTRLIGGEILSRLPLYLSEASHDCEERRLLIAAIREADGIIIASPGYHGTVSGLVKNALDYIEETARDARVYLDGLPVGLIATAHGWQATGGTLATLRAITHALRGWPTPMGAAINTGGGLFRDGRCEDAAAATQLDLVGRQVAAFALRKSLEELTNAA